MFPQCRGTIACNNDGGLTAKPTNAAGRAARMDAHAAFDRLWKEGIVGNRKTAYRWMRKVMGMTAAEAHIRYFNKTQCETLIAYVEIEMKEREVEK